MSINQITITTMAIILTAFTSGAIAGPGNKDNAGKSGHEQQKGKPDKQQVVDSREQNRDWGDRRDNDGRDRDDHKGGDNNDGWGWGDYRYNHGWGSDDYRRNENSNRQSDPDSTRGLERAAERRSDNANKNMQTEEERPRRWYDFWPDKYEQDRHGLAKESRRWWWPFN